MPRLLVSHYMDLLWCIAPTIDTIITLMPSISNDINSLTLFATAKYVIATITPSHTTTQIRPCHGPLELLLSDHIIRHDLWRELAQAMITAGLKHNPACQHVAQHANVQIPE